MQKKMSSGREIEKAVSMRGANIRLDRARAAILLANSTTLRIKSSASRNHHMPGRPPKSPNQSTSSPTSPPRHLPHITVHQLRVQRCSDQGELSPNSKTQFPNAAALARVSAGELKERGCRRQSFLKTIQRRGK